MWNVEYTDTFGGEPNYCWVRRQEIENTEDTAKLKRLAKKSVGIAGLPGRWYDNGDYYEFRPYRMCTILILSYKY